MIGDHSTIVHIYDLDTLIIQRIHVPRYYNELVVRFCYMYITRFPYHEILSYPSIGNIYFTSSNSDLFMYISLTYLLNKLSSHLLYGLVQAKVSLFAATEGAKIR